MTADFVRLSQSLESDTPDKVWVNELHERAAEIANDLKTQGFYENKRSGLKIVAQD